MDGGVCNVVVIGLLVVVAATARGAVVVVVEMAEEVMTLEVTAVTAATR